MHKDTEELFVGIDLGTSSCKVVGFDSDGREVGVARQEYDVIEEGKRVEQHPSGWWDATRTALGAFRRNVPSAPIRVIGVTGLGTGYLPLDNDGRPLRNAILSFMDRRIDDVPIDKDDLAYIQESLVANALWLRRNEPAVFEATAAIVDAREYLGYRLTGELTRDEFWFPDELIQELSETYDLPTAIIPPPHTYTDPIGTVSEEVTDLGIDPSTPVTIGPWDGLSSVVGSGLHQPGRAMAVSGTTCIVGVSTSLGAEAANIRHPIDGVGLRYETDPVGVANQWFAENVLGQARSESVSYADVDRLVAAVADEEAPVFIPTIGGTMASPDLRGGYIGVTASHTIEHLAKAVYEGEAYYLRDVFGAVPGETSIEDVRVGGGGARSEAWNRIRADVTGKSVKRLGTVETAALGAAILGAVAIDQYDDISAAIESMVSVTETFEPRDIDYEQSYGAYTACRELLDDLYSA